LHRRAQAELVEAADEYDRARPGLGDEFTVLVEQAIESILAAPQRWPLVDQRHRRYLLRRFPYSIFYRFDEAEIIVVAIAHRRRRPGYWSRRR